MKIPSVTSYLVDKVEEFRINVRAPSYIGMTEELLTRLSEEVRKASNSQVVGMVTEFLGVPVICMGGPTMPADGIYIHPVVD